MLKQAGLLSLMNAVNDPSVSGALSRVPDLDGKSVNQVLSTSFDSFLSSIHYEVGQHLHQVMSAKHAKSINAMSIQNFVLAYRALYNAIVDPKNEYEFPQTSVLTRSPEDVERVVGSSQQ
jgi:hypothetical protein